MAKDKDTIKKTYPLPVYNYRVEIGDAPMAFAEVSGLSVSYTPVTYKHGLSFARGSVILPGMRQPLRVTLRRGLTRSRSELQQWMKEIYELPYKDEHKRDIDIHLCDEAGQTLIQWHLTRAMPVRLDAPTFDASSNTIAIEEIEVIAHRLQVTYPSAEKEQTYGF